MVTTAPSWSRGMGGGEWDGEGVGHGRIGSGRRERTGGERVGGGESGRGRSGSWEEVREGVIRRKRYQKER